MFRAWAVVVSILALLGQTDLLALSQADTRQAGEPPRPDTCATCPAHPEVRGRLSGLVLDSETRRPKPGATVTVGNTTATTGGDGRFTIEIAPGPAVIEVSAAGYFGLTSPVIVDSRVVTEVELLMQPETTVSEHVEVRARRSETTPAVRSVEPESVLRMPGALDNVFRALQALPGVGATQEAAGFITVRGGSPDQNLTMLDGVEVHDPYRLYGLTSAFNPDTIQRFDLATGGFSVKYGDRLSSLLSVESRDGAPGRWLRGQASMGLTDANVVLEGALPRVNGGSWMVSARRTYYDVVAGLVSDQQFPAFDDVQSKVVWTPRVGSKLTAFGLRSRQGGNVRVTDTEVDVRFRDDTRNDLGWARFETTLGTRAHSMTVAGVSRTRIATGFDGLFTDTGRRSNAPDGLPARRAVVGFGYGTVVRDISFRQELGWTSGAHTLNGGAEAHGLATTLELTLQGDRNPNVSGSSIQAGAGLPDELRSGIRSTRTGAWIEDIWNISAAASVQIGLRLDRVGATRETLWSPRVSASWDVGNTTRVRAAFGRYTQSPGYEKLTGDYLLDLTNPAAQGLRSQEALLASVAFERDLGRSASVRVEGYHKRFDNLLVGLLESEPIRTARVASYDFPADLRSHIPTNAIITSAPANEARGRAYGFDVLVRRTTVSSGSRLRGWASYTWGKADREAYGLRFPFEYDRRHAFTTVVSYQVSPRWEIATTTRVASGFARTTPLGLRVAGLSDAADVDGDGNRDELIPERDPEGRLVYVADFGGVENLQRGRLPLFARVDLRLTWQSTSRRWEVYGEVLNATNRKNAGVLTPKLEHDPASDRPRLVEDRDQWLPLLPSAGLRLRF